MKQYISKFINIIEYLSPDVITDWQKETKRPVYLIQGCNCYRNMGGGLAALIRNRFPECEKVDTLTDKNIPGNYSYYEHRNGQGIINAYTQGLPGGIRKGSVINSTYYKDSKEARFSYIKESLNRIKRDFKPGIIYIPKIGAGIAGGEWEQIRKCIKDTFKGSKFTVKISYWDKEWIKQEFENYINQ